MTGEEESYQLSQLEESRKGLHVPCVEDNVGSPGGGCGPSYGHCVRHLVGGFI